MGARAGIPAGLLAAWAALAVQAGAAPPSDQGKVQPPPGPGGALVRLADPFGCHLTPPVPPMVASKCTGAQGLGYVLDIAVAPGGTSVYAVSTGEEGGAGTDAVPGDSITAFARDPATGNLTHKGCISHGGVGGCQMAGAMKGPFAVTVSPDGKSVYVASAVSGAVAIFARDLLTGALTQKGCIGHASGCQKVGAMKAPIGMAVSPDGKHVYVASRGDFDDGSGNGLVVLKRVTSGPDTGQLSFVSCLRTGKGCEYAQAILTPDGVTVSPDGKSVYVTDYSGDSVASFARDAATGELTQLGGSEACVSNDTGSGPVVLGCKSGKALEDAFGLRVSPDGKNVYVAASESGLAIFSRDPGTGALGQLGCLNKTGVQGCAKAVRLAPWRLALSPDGKFLYAASPNLEKSGLAIFGRNIASGLLTQLAPPNGCLGPFPDDPDGCGSAFPFGAATSVAVSADGKNAYAGSVITASGGLIGSFARSIVPECKSKTVSNKGGSGADIQLDCTGAANLTYSIVSQPSNATVTINQATATAYYAPKASFVGPDPFTYKASNGSVESAPATITVNNVPG